MSATRNPLVRLEHIRDEIVAISAVLRGVDRDRYVQDYLLQRGAERALLIISEAARSLPSDLLQQYPEVDWSEIIGLGNVLRHEYHMLDASTIWDILTKDLMELAPVIDRMIKDISTS